MNYTFYLIVILLSIVKASDSYMYVFAQEWPGSVCRIDNCQKEYMGNFDARRWNVHGFWPNTVESTYCGQIDHCREDAYDPAKISPDTYDLIDLVWNGLYSETQDFRAYEWAKHGTCYPGEVSQNYYFSLVGNMANKYNYYEILASAGIFPDDNQLITDTQVRNAFYSVVGQGAKITFSCLKESSTGKVYLGQMKVCFNNALQPRTCDCKKPIDEKMDNNVNSTFISCGTQFYYPTYQTVKLKDN